MSIAMDKNPINEIRNGIIGINQTFISPYGAKKIIYADWIASGRLYKPIEDKLANDFGPFVANTHTETNVTGSTMTHAYEEAKKIIKQHVNASSKDVLINCGSGMTGALAKLQRILGFKIPEQISNHIVLQEKDKPIVFVTHAEHHSNHTSWLETICDVVVIPPDENGKTCPQIFKQLVLKYQNRNIKIASITAGSNVTGYIPPYYEIAKIIHEYGGLCFVDFACAAPYVNIDMHPADKLEQLDAIYFSPHKFLGGPGTCGVLIFNEDLYHNKIPDIPGGGTVKWTNPWGGHSFIENIEVREDGGTPPFLQTIKTALCIKLKEKIGCHFMEERETELVNYCFEHLSGIPNLHILADNIKNRLGVISFYIDDLHYNLAVKILNDRFGIQVRGGCSCAGTYGHYLLNVSEDFSSQITCKIDSGDLTQKPGWVRLSLHPLMTNDELKFVVDAIIELSKNHQNWAMDYRYESSDNQYFHLSEIHSSINQNWFNFG